MKHKLLLVAVSAFITVLFVAVCLLGDVGLALFNVALGNHVYALTVTYTPAPKHYNGELVGVTFTWRFTLQKTKVPIETILTNIQTKTAGAPNFSLSNKTFLLTFTVTVEVGNHIKLFRHTFTFEDAAPREITVYLHKMKASQGEANVEANGYYVLDGPNVPVNVGDHFEIEK